MNDDNIRDILIKLDTFQTHEKNIDIKIIQNNLGEIIKKKLISNSLNLDDAQSASCFFMDNIASAKDSKEKEKYVEIFKEKFPSFASIFN